MLCLRLALRAYVDKSLHQGISYAEYHTKLRLKYMRNLPSDARKVKPPRINSDFIPTYNQIDRFPPFIPVQQPRSTHRGVYRNTFSMQEKVPNTYRSSSYSRLIERQPDNSEPIAMTVEWGWRRNREGERERERDTYQKLLQDFLCIFYKTRCLHNQYCP